MDLSSNLGGEPEKDFSSFVTWSRSFAKKRPATKIGQAINPDTEISPRYFPSKGGGVC